MPKVPIRARVKKRKRYNEASILAERREQGTQNRRGQPCRGEGSVKSQQNVSSQASTYSQSEESLPNVTPTQSEECFVGMPKEELSSNNDFNPEVELLQHNSQQEQKAHPTASHSLTSDGCIHNPAAVCLRIQDVEMLPGSDFKNESDALFIESHQGESDNLGSHCLTVLRIDSADISHCESPVVKVRDLKVRSETPSVSEGVLEALKINLEPRLLSGWKLHIDNERIYAIALVPNKDKFLVSRAVHVACDGSNWKVQVHLETLPEGHPIYTEETLKPFVPLTLDSVGDFTTAVIRATAAVQLQRVCIGVDLPSCVEKWTNHPDCTLDTNQFEEPGYEKTLRHKTCSYLVSRRAKRCAACNRYMEMVRSREERRHPGGAVNPSTRHDYLTPTCLRQLAKHKQEKIRLQGALLSSHGRKQEQNRVFVNDIYF